MTGGGSNPVDYRKKRVLINSMSGVVTLFLNLSFIIWLYQFLLTRIPADEFAIYPVLMVVMTLIPVLSSFFSSALSREVIAAYASDESDQVTRLHSSVVLSLAGFLALFLAVGVFTSSRIEYIIQVPEQVLPETRLMVVVIFADVALSVFGIPFSTAFEVKQRFVWRDVITFTGNVIRIVITGGLLVTFGAQVVWLPLASVAANMVVFVWIWLGARRVAPEYRVHREMYSLRTMRGLLSFGFWTSLGTISLILYQSSGPVLLNLLSTPEQVNSFFIGSVIDRRILGLMTVALAPVLPVLTTMSVTRDFTRLGNTYMRGGRYALWVSLAVAAPLFVYAHEFIELYLGATYRDAASVTMVLLATFPITYADVMLSRVAIATAKLKWYFSVGLVSTVLMAILSWIVLKTSNSGAIGVAIALSVVNVASHLLFFWPYGIRLAGISSKQFLRQTVWRGWLPAAAGIAVWFALKEGHDAASWPALFLHGAIGGIVYIATLVVFCLQPDERRSIAKVLSFRRAVVERLAPTTRS